MRNNLKVKAHAVLYIGLVTLQDPQSLQNGPISSLSETDVTAQWIGNYVCGKYQLLWLPRLNRNVHEDLYHEALIQYISSLIACDLKWAALRHRIPSLEMICPPLVEWRSTQPQPLLALTCFVYLVTMGIIRYLLTWSERNELWNETKPLDINQKQMHAFANTSGSFDKETHGGKEMRRYQKMWCTKTC